MNEDHKIKLFLKTKTALTSNRDSHKKYTYRYYFSGIVYNPFENPLEEPIINIIFLPKAILAIDVFLFSNYMVILNTYVKG